MEEFTLNYLVVFTESNKNYIYALENLISPKYLNLHTNIFIFSKLQYDFMNKCIRFKFFIIKMSTSKDYRVEINLNQSRTCFDKSLWIYWFTHNTLMNTHVVFVETWRTIGNICWRRTVINGTFVWYFDKLYYKWPVTETFKLCHLFTLYYM